MQRLIIDTDTASDDAVAILMALRSPEVHVEAITIVAGNVPVEMGARNAGYTAQLCGREVPIYIGCERPLVREPHWAFFFHGPDGMGGMNLPPPRRPPEPEHAVDALIRLIRSAPGELTLVTLGPLTNVAMALRKAPDIAGKVKQCVVMGGAACTVGNITPAAEYNIWVDPEAARIVLHSGMPILMVGWEHSRGPAALTEAEIEALYALDTPFARFAMDCNRSALEASVKWLGEPGLTLPDPVTMAIVLEPEVCTARGRHFVDVETDSELTRGMTVVDRLGVTGRAPNVEVCWAIDPARWKTVLRRCLQ
ncbi:nucleoside hydrolase [Thermoflexus hugenholtzii]